MHRAGIPLRAHRLLALYGAAALRPSIIHGKYRVPMISPRIASEVRKRAIIEGTYGSFCSLYGGWDPTWEKPKNMYLLKPHRGHLRERTRETRAAKITTAMKGMPERVQKYRQDIADKKPKKDIMYLFRRAERLSMKK